MARDKAKDDKLFNCSEEHERNYVATLYGANRKSNVLTFLTTGCNNKTIFHSTHLEVYKMIKAGLGYEIPVAE